MSIENFVMTRLEPIRRQVTRWDSSIRNQPLSLPWMLLNIPKKTRTRVSTGCVFCHTRIGRGQDRFFWTTPYSKIKRNNYFNLHEHCYYALINLSIEKLRQQLPSNMQKLS